MLKQLCLAGAAVAFMSSTALAAEYFIVQDRATKKCKVVDVRPTETTWVQIGPLAFKTREEADKQVAVVCKERR
jgi:hypothetical protein